MNDKAAAIKNVLAARLKKKPVATGKPSAGMSAKTKSTDVKQAQAGKDMGAPGKNFSKIAAKAGGGEKGNKIAGAIFWKKMGKKA